jgi:hypothetical protein
MEFAARLVGVGWDAWGWVGRVSKVGRRGGLMGADLGGSLSLGIVAMLGLSGLRLGREGSSFLILICLCCFLVVLC